MEEKVIKLAAIVLSIMAVGVTVLLYNLPHIRQEIHVEENGTEAKKKNMSAKQMITYSTNKARLEGEIKQNNQLKVELRIELPKATEADDVEIDVDALAQRVDINIPNAELDYFYNDKIVGDVNNFTNIDFKHTGTNAKISLGLQFVPEIELNQQKKYLYVDFLTPHERYDKVVVIDAGHGGNSSGAESGDVVEKDVDLAVMLKLKELLEAEENIGVYCTRTEDVNPTINARNSLIDATKADLFVSVHCNSMKNEKFSYISGTEVVYQKAETDISAESKKFAQLCLDEVADALGSLKRGIIPADNVELVDNSKAPVALIELGFITNEDECSKLAQEEYQQKAAEGIYNAVMKYINGDNF